MFTKRTTLLPATPVTPEDVEQLRAQAAIADAAERDRQAMSADKSNGHRLAQQKLKQNHLLPATAQDYNRWLRGYMAKGHAPERHSARPFGDTWDRPLWEAGGFWVATSDFNLVKVNRGAPGVHVIVPAGIRCLSKRTWSNSLYWMEDYSTTSGWVESYPDAYGQENVSPPARLPKGQIPLKQRRATRRLFEALVEKYDLDPEVARGLSDDFTKEESKAKLTG